ncbi:MAG: caspase family protein [Cyanobacteria bacterium J06643_13]
MSATATTTQQFKQGTAKFWIVLVGVNRYLDINIVNLKYCANDCEELADALKVATGEFQHAEIISLYDGGNLSPERSQIINSIQQFRLAQAEDTVLFYFSGHGYLDSNNRPVLCVADTRLEDLAETGLKLDFLLNELSQCRAQRQLVWLDACQEREQQPDNQIKHNPTQQLSAALKEQAEKSKNFHGMLSCDRTERSWEIEELQHGLFTYCLIEGLRGKAANSRGQIDADGLFNYVERISQRIIEDKKHPGAETLSKGMMVNVQQIKQSSPPPKTKRLPVNASQTPQRIVKGGGELVFLIGLAAPTNNRKALVIDRLSNSEANIGLCKLLQAQGNFAVEYRYLRDKQQWQLQQDIARYLAANNRTVLLYLSGTIESTANQTYELVYDSQHRIDLNWLAKELKASPVREIVVIANITKATENTPSLESILQLNYDLPLCLIEATSQSGDRRFLAQLVTTLETAAKAEREFWVTDLISPLQKWSLEQPDIEVTGWWGTVGIIEILSVEVQRSDNRVFDIEVCPYKSLEAFSQDDAYFFHGREELVTKIIKKLKSNSFLAVVGASGSGKSSVVRAGVIPKLVTHGLNTSQSQQTQACQTWVMLPGDSPFTALARAIAPNEAKLLEGVLHVGVEGFVDWLRQQPQAISVLAIDQFEELFTLTPEKERIDFIRLIIAAVERAGDCFKVIITLRGDFINECLNLSEIAPLIEQNEILVPVKSSRLEDNQYRQIISQPAQKVGLEVEDGLMAVLLEELKDGSLPLLQYALEELWQKRREGKLTLKDYQQYIGRLGQFLSDKAEATYQNLNQLQQECAQSIFLSLVYLAQEQDKTNKDTRRRLLKSDLQVSKYKDTLDDTLQALIDARLIVVSGEESDRSLVTDSDLTNALAVADKVREINSDRDKDTVEIAHEILIDNWKTLEGWLKDNRDKYRLIREINQSAGKWKQNGKQNGFLLSKGALAKYEEFYVKYADELSEVSDRFMEASIQARDKADKLAKRRQRQFISGLTGVITILVTMLVFALGQLRRATINEIDALNNSAEALLESDKKLDALVATLKAVEKSSTTFVKLDKGAKIKLTIKLQNILHDIKEINRLDGYVATFSPNGRYIASATIDNNIKIWNYQGKLIHEFKALQTTNDTIRSIKFSPNGKMMASVGLTDNSVKLWDLNGNLLKSFKSETKANKPWVSFDFGSDSKRIFLNSNNHISIWNINGEFVGNIQNTESKYYQSIDVSFNNKNIAVAAGEKIKLWSFNGQFIRTIPDNSLSKIDYAIIASLKIIDSSKTDTHYLSISDVEFSPNNKIIASASDDGTIRLWNINGKLLKNVGDHANKVLDIDFHSSGNLIASASLDNTVRIWNIGSTSTGNYIIHSAAHTGGAESVEFSPDGKIVASAGADMMVRLWNVEDKNTDKSKGNCLDSVSDKSVKFSYNRQIYAVISDEKKIKICDSNNNIINTINTKKSINTIAVSSNGNFFASYHKDKINLWNIKGNRLDGLEGGMNLLNDMSFSLDEQSLAFANKDSYYLWHFHKRTLKTVDDYSSYSSAIERRIAFHPNKNLFASIGNEGRINLWNLEGELLRAFKAHSNIIKNLIFSPDGKLLISASVDKTIKIWNLEGHLLHTLEGHKSQVDYITFSPDGKILASASNLGIAERHIKIWNLEGDLLHTLKGHTDNINSISFSPDGNFIVSSSNDKTIKIWNLKGELINSLNTHDNYVDEAQFSFNGDAIISLGQYDEKAEYWSLDLDEVMSRGCDWARDYLGSNPNVSEEDRKICDGY